MREIMCAQTVNIELRRYMIGHRCRLRCSVALLIWATILRPVTGQSTTSQYGCSFSDGQNVFNVELVSEEQDLACPLADTLREQAVGTSARTDEVDMNVRQLRSLIGRLQDRNQQLYDRINGLKVQLQNMKNTLGQGYDVCPDGYDLRNDKFRSCYMFVGRYWSWYDAEAFCLSSGGHLVALESDEEQQFLINHVKSNNVLPGNHLWTGGNDIARENDWMWAGVNRPFNYTRWLLYPHTEHGPIQMPDNYLQIEHCVHLFHLHNYDWNDLYCGNGHYFICEHKLL